MPGQMISGYRMVDKLGEGGMGTVYVAEHELLGKKVAIKVLLAEHSQNPELVQRFFNEARAATRINHPGIVEIFDFGHAQDGSATSSWSACAANRWASGWSASTPSRPRPQSG